MTDPTQPGQQPPWQPLRVGATDPAPPPGVVYEREFDPSNPPPFPGGDGGGKKRSWFARHKALTVVLSIVGAFFVLGGIGAALGGSSDEGGKVVAAASSTADSTKGTALDPNYSPPPAAPPAPTSTGVDPATTVPAPPAQPELTTGQEQAIGAAEDYLELSGFSRLGLIEQLSSDYGSGFSKADARFAVDHLKVNWNEQAVRVAKEYLATQHFSRSGLIEQLSSQYGSQFTRAQATYAADKVGL